MAQLLLRSWGEFWITVSLHWICLRRAGCNSKRLRLSDGKDAHQPAPAGRVPDPMEWIERL